MQMQKSSNNMYPNQTNNLFTNQANSNMFPKKIIIMCFQTKLILIYSSQANSKICLQIKIFKIYLLVIIICKSK